MKTMVGLVIRGETYWYGRTIPKPIRPIVTRPQMSAPPIAQASTSNLFQEVSKISPPKKFK
jgi:hypothetical protein